MDGGSPEETTPAGLPGPRLLGAGASAFVVEFGNEISLALSARATALARLLDEEPFEGYLECVSSYRSVLVLHDPAADPVAIRAHALRLARRAGDEAPAPQRRLEIPCVFDGEDLPELAAHAGLAVNDVVRLHTDRDFRVLSMGFVPGFPYMGMTDPRLDMPRRPVPRLRVPAGSLITARRQLGMYPWEAPTGWRLLGRVDPSILWNLDRDPPTACLAGDVVRFRAVPDLPRSDRAPPRGSGVPAEGRPVIEVEKGGLQTTVQDLGRRGYLHLAVPRSGASDPASLRLANRVVGNPDGAAGLEMALMGPVLRFRGEATFALGGADHGALLQMPGRPPWKPPPGTAVVAPEGSVLRFTGPPAGLRAYLAVAGGIAVPEVMGSRSTYQLAGFGGLEGRSLRRGDLLHVGPGSPGAREHRFLPEAVRPPQRGTLRLRISLGPQDDCFTPDCLEELPDLRFKVSGDSNRMGVRLEGPALTHVPGRNEIVSDASPPGAVQVPASGRPIVMGPEHGATGGYPKLGVVTAPDLARLGQALPGSEVAFEVVSPEEARALTLAETRRIASIG